MVIAIDFDGTCVEHSFPEIGKDIGSIPVLKKLINAGHKLILFTMRSDGQEDKELENGYKLYAGDFLSQAVNWFKNNEITLYGIQSNPTQGTWTTSPKCYAELYIDDAALGIPLIEPANSRPYVDWNTVEKILEEKGIL